MTWFVPTLWITLWITLFVCGSGRLNDRPTVAKGGIEAEGRSTIPTSEDGSRIVNEGHNALISCSQECVRVVRVEQSYPI